MRPDVHLEPGCPWYRLSELRLPNVDWCETQRCSWVVEPANAWSNVAYLVIGIALIALARPSPSAHVRTFGPAAIVVGLASGIYHASYTFVLQILDFAGMYVFLGLLIAATLRRAGWLRADVWRRRYVQGVLAMTVLTAAFDFTGLPIQALVFVGIVAVVAAEVRLSLRDPKAHLGALAASAGLMACAGVFSLLDVTRTWCLPDHAFLQGHAIWHVLSAFGLLAAFFHYRQFEGALAPD